MLMKLFWIMAVALYGSAAIVASSPSTTGVDYRFWILIGLGTLCAVLGNVVHNAARWDRDSQEPHAPRH